MPGNGDADGEEGGERTHHGSATLPGNCSLGSTHSATGLKFPSDDGSECSSVTSESVPGAHTTSPHSLSNPPSNTANTDVLTVEIRRNKQEIERLKDKLEAIKVSSCVYSIYLFITYYFRVFMSRYLMFHFLLVELLKSNLVYTLGVVTLGIRIKQTIYQQDYLF